MGKLLENTNIVLEDVQNKVDLLLSEINNYNEIYTSDYILKELKDADYLKEMMIEKIELGIKSYDNK